MVNDNKEFVIDKKKQEIFNSHFENLLNRPDSTSNEIERT